MDLAAARFLVSEAGAEALMRAATDEGDVLRRVETAARSLPPALARAVVRLTDLRARARHRFAEAGRMFFTEALLAQASSGKVAAWRAARFPPSGAIADLTCGAGSDASALAAGRAVLASDPDPVAVVFCRANLRAVVPGARALCVVARAPESWPADIPVFLDPSRRSGRGRTLDPELGMPPLSAILDRAARHTAPVAVKLAPAVSAAALPRGAAVEFVSEGGELKECVLWLHGGPPEVRASIAEAGYSLSAPRFEALAPLEITSPLRFVFDPDPALTCSKLLSVFAAEHGLRGLDARVGFLTGDEPLLHPALATFEVEEDLPFDLRALNGILGRLGVGRVEIRRRGIPVSEEEIRKRLRLRGESERTLVVARLSDRRRIFVTRRLRPASAPELPPSGRVSGGNDTPEHRTVSP